MGKQDGGDSGLSLAEVALGDQLNHLSAAESFLSGVQCP